MTEDAMYDIVIANGRIMDPESCLDMVGSVGIANGIIKEITDGFLSATEMINAEGMVVAPGFIDLHCHPQDLEIFEVQARDGVTTTLELEIGAGDVDEWYSRWEGKAAVNFGASIGHVPARMQVMNDPGMFVPSGDAGRRVGTCSEVEDIKKLVVEGLNKGALAVGFGLDYTPAASHWEIIEMFRIAAEHRASCHVHLRGRGQKGSRNAIEALEEVIAASAITGASLHVVHINSTGMGGVPQLLEMIEGARNNGIDVTTECYPYTAGMTRLESTLFDEGWQEQYGIDYDSLQWPATGEFLTSQTFAQYRESGGWVITHATPVMAVKAAVKSPLTMIATDSIIQEGRGHPRTAGCYSRVLGRFVRESGDLELMEALAKMTIMPAKRLQQRAVAFENKGRLKVGSDADVTVFDPATVIDNSTYENPTAPPTGIEHVLVNGVPVVSRGRLEEGAVPGKGIRA